MSVSENSSLRQRKQDLLTKIAYDRHLLAERSQRKKQQVDPAKQALQYAKTALATWFKVRPLLAVTKAGAKAGTKKRGLLMLLGTLAAAKFMG
jgi:hypothetical protein